MSTAIETARLTFGSPLEIFAALGHGRSYGLSSTVAFVRTLPSILECGIWDALDSPSLEGGRVPTFALITDIGNDIIYGQSPQHIVGWVEQCIERLQRHQACIGLTMLPIQSVQAVRWWQYQIVKLLLYPTRKLTYVDALARADDLHERLMNLAQRRQVRIIQAPPHWYGFDPIHIQMRHWAAAWRQMLSACGGVEARQVRLASGSLRRWARLRSLTPQRWRLAGWQRGRPQPAGVLSDGTTISLY